MKKVTFTGTKDGSVYGAVQVGENVFPLNQAVVVSDSDADDLKGENTENFEFKVTTAPKGAEAGQTDAPADQIVQTEQGSSEGTGVTAANSGTQR